MVTFWVGAVGKIIFNHGISDANCSATSAKPVVECVGISKLANNCIVADYYRCHTYIRIEYIVGI
jgi:hypothetical protein